MGDLSAMQAAKLDESIARAIRVPESDGQVGLLDLPIDSERANKALHFGSNGELIAVVPSDASGTVVTASGSTTGRALAERFAEVVNVKDHGATGDGVTDDTAAIRAAFTAAKAAGTYVFFPAGSYIISDRIVFEAPMMGADPRTTVIKAGAAFLAANAKTFDGAADVDPASDRITITAHGFATAQPVTYDDGGGTAVAGLANRNVYWTIAVDANTLELAASEAAANAGTAIDLTADGAGTAHSLTLRRMMLDFNQSSYEDKKFIKNLKLDLNNTAGLTAWNSTSPGGGGGSAQGTYEQIAFINGANDSYVIDCVSNAVEGAFLTGASLKEVSVSGCKNAIRVDANVDDCTFIGFRPQPNVSGTETLPFLDLSCQNSKFIDTFIGGIGPIGYMVTPVNLAIRPLIRLGASVSTNINFLGLFVETTKGTTDMTHIFYAVNSINVYVSDLRINVDDPSNTARAVAFQTIFSTGKRAKWEINNVTQGSSDGNPFGRLIETHRADAASADSQAVGVHFSGIDEGGFHDWPFSLYKSDTAGNKENDFFLELHGTYKGVRYDHGMNEATIASRKGERLYTVTFDSVADVDPSTDKIAATAHELKTGDPVLYEVHGGMAIVGTGIADETTLYVIRDSADLNAVKLATTQINAFNGTAIDITADGVGSGHTLTRMHKMSNLKHDQSGSTEFVGASTSSPDDQTIHLPGTGVYLINVFAQRDANPSHQAQSTYIVYYNNHTNDISGADRIGTAKTAGNVTDVVVQTAPDAQGTVTFRFTYTGGPFTNRWVISLMKINHNN